MAELKIQLSQSVTTTALVESDVEVTEVSIKRIVVIPELNRMRVLVDVAGKEVPFIVEGEDYASVVGNCDVAAIITILQTKLESIVQNA
jgi:hypothetical protein